MRNAGALALTLVLCRVALGQEPVTESTPKTRAVEEIVVTAQRREQTLHDVPMSLSVVGADFLGEKAIGDFADLATYVPGVSINNASEAIYVDVRIRGFGSAIANKAFEQSVGLVIDQVPYGRIGYWQGPLFDVERVEILRGPQGTLFGKNTTAGLFNVTMKRPTEELDGFVAVELGELGRRRFEGAVGGPLVANLVNVRVSALSDERDGFMENTTARVVAGISDRLNGRERKGVRAQLGFPNLAGGDLVIGYDHVEASSDDVGWEVRSIAPQQAPFFREYDPDSDFRPGNEIGSTDLPGSSETEIDTLVAIAAWKVGGFGLHAVAGHSVLDAFGSGDNDFTPAGLFVGSGGDRNPQTTVELRVDSEGLPGFLGTGPLFGLPLGGSDFVAGFFFQHREITDSTLDLSIHVPRTAQFVVTDRTGVVPPCPECASDAGFETISIFFGQESLALAGFGHLDWHFADGWTLGYGMRFTEEDQEASWLSRFSRGAGVAFRGLLNAEEVDTARERSEFAFTPKVTLAWDWTDAVNLYAGWGTGYKSGGFNATIFNDNTEDGLLYGPERATSWELGTKLELLGGAAAANLGLFRQTVTDLQVLSITSDTRLLVENAGEARSQGVEADGTWLATDWLTLRGTLAFTDSEYVKFPHGGCPVDRPNTDGDDDSRCDLSGRPLQFTPKWTATVTPLVRHSLATLPGLGALAPFALAGVDLLGSLTVEYNDVHFANENLDPRERQSSFIRLGGDLGFGHLERGWSLRVIAQNLTDEDTVARVQQVNIVGRSYAQIAEPPRLFFGEFRWSF